MKYGLVGRRLVHSLSPLIHTKTGALPYELCELEPECIERFFEKREFDGINVTIPYKTEAFRLCDELSPLAKRIGAVNTVVKRCDGTLYGDNTDYYGLRCMFEQNNICPEGKKALILGTGGSSLTARAVLEDLGAKEIINISRSGENNYSNLSLHSDASVIVNTTPVGMFPDKIKDCPVDLDIFPSCEGVVDLIFNPLSTALVLEAKKRNIKAVGGMTMLVRQGFRAAEQFLGCSYTEEQMIQAEKEVLEKVKNIVLVGMPGCGKSTLGRLLSEKLGREFIDTDSIIEEKYGNIPEIFKNHGEEYFRCIESDAVFEASIKQGKIIATGGGAVLKEENRRYLRHNSTVIFLNRDIKALPKDGRPLSQGNNALEEMYKKRLPLYRQACDYELDIQNDITENLNNLSAIIKNM